MLFTKRFLPLFTVQFLGAFNDNVFKNALVMLITFQMANNAAEIGLLITLAAGLFILPFFLFSATAGKIADSYNKTKLIQKIKLAEILIMLMGAFAFWLQDLTLLFTVLFLMGLQSTFFGPIKYAILPEHLSEDELLTGNGWFSASTFVSILLGTIIGGFLVLTDGGMVWLSGLIVLLSTLGYGVSLMIPPSIVPAKKLPFSLNFAKTTWQEIKRARQYPQAFFAILAISWFWFLGATYLSQMPIIVKELIFADEQVVLLFLATFSVGIAIGAFIVNIMNIIVRKMADIAWLALLLFGISIAMALLNLMIGMIEKTEIPLSIENFVVSYPPLAILALLAIIAVLGGMYIVPLYTLLQVQTPQGSRSRMVAVNNITNAVFMVVSAILIMVLYTVDYNLVDIFTLIAVLNFLVFIWFYTRTKYEISL